MFVKLKKVMDDRKLSVKECVLVKGSRRGISHNFSTPSVERDNHFFRYGRQDVQLWYRARLFSILDSFVEVFRMRSR